MIKDVAAAVHASTSSVKRWRDAYEAQGDAGLNSIPNEGRPPRLNEKQRKRLTRVLLKGARASGYPNDLWTCPRVAEVIQRLFGVHYHVDHIGKLLHRLGWSVQKPERRARERDEAAIAAVAEGGVAADKKREPSKKLAWCSSTKVGSCCSRSGAAPGLRGGKRLCSTRGIATTASACWAP